MRKPSGPANRADRRFRAAHRADRHHLAGLRLSGNAGDYHADETEEVCHEAALGRWEVRRRIVDNFSCPCFFTNYKIYKMIIRKIKYFLCNIYKQYVM